MSITDDFFLVDVDFDKDGNPITNEKEVVEEKEHKVTFFDLFNDICNHGDYIDNFFTVKKEMPKEYNAYMMNKAFANFSDTILIANEVNKYYNIPDEIQWRFYKNTIPKKKRFSKNARHTYSKLVSCAETWRLDKKMWPFDERASCKEWTKNQS